MIKVSNLEKKYGKTVVLKDINITFPEKGLVSILGKSGSGKSTLLNVLGGIDSCNKGNVVIKGIDIANASRGKIDFLRRNEIGFVFQDYSLVESMTVYDNIKASLDILRFSDRDEIRKRIFSVLDVVDLSGFENRLVSNLSGGQQQRVSIARALAKDPSIMLCDEPTGNLDSKNTLKVMEELKAISKNKLVILVTHEKDIADFYSDRIITIKDGSIVSDTKEQSTSLERKEESDFYLKDLDKDEFKFKKLLGRFYQEKGSTEENELTVIVQNDKIYVKSDKNTILDVNKNSRYRFINESYDATDKSRVKDSIGIEVNFKPNEEVKKKTAIVDTFHEGLTNFRKMYNKKRKYIRGTLVYGFMSFLLSIFLIYGISYNAGNKYYSNMHDERYSYYIDSNLSSIDPFTTAGSKISSESDAIYVTLGSIDGTPVTTFTPITYTELSENYINSTDKHSGKVENLENNEVVISNLIADEILYKNTTKTMNIKTYDQLIGKRISDDIGSLSDELEGFSQYKIVGVVDSDVMVIYYSEAVYNYRYVMSSQEWKYWDDTSDTDEKTYISMNQSSKELVYDDSSYNIPLEDDEVLVTRNYLLDEGISVGDTVIIEEKDFVIVGTYNPNFNMFNLLLSDYVVIANDKMADAINLSRAFKFQNNYGAVLYTNSKDELENELDNIQGITYFNSNYVRKAYEKSEFQGLLVVSMFLSIILFITMFIVFRIDLLKRTKILGVSRILGRSSKSIILASILQSVIMFILFALLGITAGALITQFMESFSASYQIKGALITSSTIIVVYMLIFGLMLLANFLALVTVVLRKEPINLIRAHDV